MARKDISYKENLKIKGYTKVRNNEYKNDYYIPDIVFESDNKLKSDQEIIIVEQSSNAMKKVHIAELTQFIELAISKKESNQKLNFLLILTQKKENSPKGYLKRQVRRLSYYIKNIFVNLPKNYCKAVGKIYIVEDCDNILLNTSLKLSDDDKFLEENVKIVEIPFSDDKGR